MHESRKIEYIAHFSKYLVDLSSAPQAQKDSIKSSIDLASQILKLFVESRNANIVRIQEAALHYNLDRIVVFPCAVQGETRTFIRMYGGDIPAFCEHLGISLLSNDNLPANSIYISQMEQQHGVILYERH